MTNSRLVYSTGPGGAARAGAGESGGPAEPRAGLPPERQEVRVRLERSGRRGKTVTVASPLVLTEEDARKLLGDLKRRLGSGGTLQSPGGAEAGLALELQGDHAERLVAELASRGYRVRRSGGQ